VLVDFDRDVDIHHHHHHFSNHFFDSKHHRFERIDAVNRLHWGASTVRGTALSGASITPRTQAVTTGMNAITTSRSAYMNRQAAGPQFHATAGSVVQRSAPVRSVPSTGRMRSVSPSVRGGAATHWEGGHSFGGFSGSSGGRFSR
jgi:hypothetical protein